MERRHEDPIIVAIHARLDTLEDLSRDFKEIKEWIETVMRFTRLMERFVDFFTRWGIRFLKVGAILAAIWAGIKLGFSDFMDNIAYLIRSLK